MLLICKYDTSKNAYRQYKWPSRATAERRKNNKYTSIYSLNSNI